VTTATEHAVEDETVPLAVQQAEVGTNRCASVPATARSGVRKIRWCLHLVTENDHLSHRKASAEPDGIWNISPETSKIMLPKSIYEVAAISMVNIRVV
jgi:hypothetical protein